MSIARSGLSFGAGTLLSRISGLIRDRIVLAVFGASGVLDAFVVAFRIPNMLRDMLAEGALGSAFTKVFSSLAVEDIRKAQALLIEALLLISLLAVGLCLVGILCAPYLVDLMTIMSPSNSYGLQLRSQAVDLTRLLFPFLGFMMVAAVAMGALQQQGRFFLTAVAPISFNVGYIIGALLIGQWLAKSGSEWLSSLSTDRRILGLVIGVLLGGCGQMAIQVVGLWRSIRAGLQVWRGELLTVEFRQLVALALPMLLAAGAGQINLVVNTIFATSLTEGSVVWLYSAFRLLHLPIGLFGVAIGVAVLPPLTRAITKANGVFGPDAAREAQTAIELVLWLMVPCFVFLKVNGAQAVQLLFQSGKFGAFDVLQTAAALEGYSFALLAYGLSKTLTSCYFAIGKTRFPMMVGFFGIAVNLIGNFILVERFEHVGLAYTYSITFTLTALALGWGLRHQLRALDWPVVARSMGILLGAALVAAVFETFVTGYLSNLAMLQNTPVWWSSGIAISGSVLVTLLVFGVAGLARLAVGPRQAINLLMKRRRSI